MRCYHFCSTEFFNELTSKKRIFPIKSDVGNRNNAYEYLFHEINEDKPMFFAWQSLENRGEKIVYLDISNIMLLTLDVPDEEVTLMNYYNWVDFIYFMELDKGGPQTIKAVKDELGCNFKTFYDCIFWLDDGYKILQCLLKKMDIQWVIDFKYVKSKIK